MARRIPPTPVRPFQLPPRLPAARVRPPEAPDPLQLLHPGVPRSLESPLLFTGHPRVHLPTAVQKRTLEYPHRELQGGKTLPGAV